MDYPEQLQSRAEKTPVPALAKEAYPPLLGLLIPNTTSERANQEGGKTGTRSSAKICGFDEGSGDLRQAVRIGDRIECSGQGGWDPTTGAISASLTAEIEQAFANVDACLRAAGGKGWGQVYKVNLYTTELSEEMFTAWAASMHKWAGETHRPLMTGVAVAGLGVPGMRVEVEVVAYLGGEEDEGEK
ncbi:Endoribonuclease L-PSP/chorismate mutase-like protein [Chaetomium tenue]|uniref:Endoribonuclease L-PSP/chorismate mutase-like protein n=1 Tax=Chaetomium tenue TaxID=1854479 RepID=A0ACB7PDS0_9PEZI|nr:Endoribonuclease L-PSP/chorismate mutase-like protein [Chaetomium globosum]